MFAQVTALFSASVVKFRHTLHAHEAATKGCWFESSRGSDKPVEPTNAWVADVAAAAL